VPTPKLIKVPVAAVDEPLTEPGPDKILQLPIPVVGVDAVIVVIGVAPHIVCVTGLIVGLLIAGSTMILAVTLLFAQLLPITPITY
jgi:hypothetical protein